MKTITITATITYWKNITTGNVYKYYNDTKPYKADTEWKQVTAWDYDEQFRR